MNLTLRRFKMETKKVIAVKDKTLTELNEILSLQVGSSDYAQGETIETFSTDLLGDGYEVDIKVVNGDDSAGAYIDAVLFLNGQEVYCLEPSFERLDGEYFFEVDDNKFSIEIVKGF